MKHLSHIFSYAHVAVIVLASNWALCAEAPTTQKVNLDSPTLVSVDWKNLDIVSAMADLSERSGSAYPVHVPWPDRYPHLTLRVESRPYLEVFQKACELGRSGLNGGNDRGFSLWPLAQNVDRPETTSDDIEHSWVAGPTFYHGPFALVARHSWRGTSMEPGKRVRSINSFMMQTDLLHEPSIVVTAIQPFARITQATDDRGMAAANLEPNPEQSAGASYNFALVLTFPPGRSRKLDRLSGKVGFRAVSEFRSITYEPLGAPISMEIDGLKCTITGPEDHRVRGRGVTLTIESPEPKKWQKQRQLIRNGSRLRAYDAAGNFIPRYGHKVDDDEPAKLVFTVHFDAKAGMPARFVWDMPIADRVIEMPFEFKDLKLP